MNNMLSRLFGGNNPMAMLSMLQSNPMQMIQRAGFNVPANVNSPQAIIQYLAQSGQVSQAQLDQAQQMASMFR